MKLQCPNCGCIVPADNVNIAADLAKCAECGELSKASELAAFVDLEDALRLPTGSVIRLQQRHDDIAFDIPAKGFKLQAGFPLVFATVWISFVAFWTWGASHASILFAMFSIPFWLAGFGMWFGILTSITLRERIEMAREKMSLRKKSLFGTRTVSIDYADISSVAMQSLVATNPMTAARQMGNARGGGDGNSVITPQIVHGATKTAFGESLDDTEQEWLCQAIKAVVSTRTGRKLG